MQYTGYMHYLKWFGGYKPYSLEPVERSEAMTLADSRLGGMSAKAGMQAV